jgi:hypothetical protein
MDKRWVATPRIPDMAPDKVYRAQEIRVIDFVASGGLDSENEKVQSDAKDRPFPEIKRSRLLKRGETLKEPSSVDDEPRASADVVVSPGDSLSESVEHLINKVIVDVETTAGKDKKASPVPEDSPDDLISFGNDSLNIRITESLGYQVMSPMMGSKIADRNSDNSISSSASDLLSPSDTDSTYSYSSRPELQLKEMVVVRDMGTQTDMLL